MFEFEQSGRRSTSSWVGGQGQIQDELRYTTEPDEAGIESPAMRDMQYATLMQQEQQQPQHDQQQQPGQQPGQQGLADGSWDERPRQADNVMIERRPLVPQTQHRYERKEKPHELDINGPTAVRLCQYTNNNNILYYNR